ncbi:hypothetical protein DICVIV_03782 [Dictyocaulus viviparus]|uniref:Uncharacterized protein n=1 Tax=Dictyocaulus viviparus TaxID=29172 RepID=A0A0D8Y650_DICVI|nr:hypothetical protein DICVIV_03782 [Dictyocaulus viviparus]
MENLVDVLSNRKETKRKDCMCDSAPAKACVHTKRVRRFVQYLDVEQAHSYNYKQRENKDLNRDWAETHYGDLASHRFSSKVSSGQEMVMVWLTHNPAGLKLNEPVNRALANYVEEMFIFIFD